MSSIDEVKSRIDIVDLVSETVQLRHSGKNYVGFCPFHSNTRTPAFVVFPDSGTWRCFGQCNEGGDIFRYVMKKEGWDFPQALQFLAEKAGVVLQPLTPEKQAVEEEYQVLRELLEEAVTFYRYHLLESADGKPAQAYLHKRGLTSATIESFGLGYGPDSWDAAFKHFTQKGYAPAELLQAGLITERESGGYYDRFRNRITFPIRDAVGKMAGFGARILNPEDQPKFLNSPQTPLFDKGRLLYALDKARKPIRSEDQVVIVEGYLDVIALHQGGFGNVVSPMGTALSEDQLRMLKRFTRRIILALDPDAAGQKATLRGLEVARQAMDHTTEMTFDARGLLRYEGRLQADLRVTTLPEGQDPDEVVLRDPEEWRKIVQAAQPVVIHVMETLAAGRNLDDPKVKSDVAAQVLPLIADVANPVERDDYRQRLARMLRVDERALLEVVPNSAQSGRPSRRRPAIKSPKKNEKSLLSVDSAAKTLEVHCLQLMLRSPEALYRVDRALLKAQVSRFSVQDFDLADHQILARLILDSLEQDQMDPNQFMLEKVPDELNEIVQRYMERIPQGEPTPNELPEDLTRSLLRLRYTRVNENLAQLRFLQEDVQENDLRQDTYSEMAIQYLTARNRLDRALKQSVLIES